MPITFLSSGYEPGSIHHEGKGVDVKLQQLAELPEVAEPQAALRLRTVGLNQRLDDSSIIQPWSMDDILLSSLMVGSPRGL